MPRRCALPTPRFDVVISTFGVMFTPDQDSAAAELLRVCKSGGKIGLANWTPEGFIGQLFKTLGKYLPPPAGAKSPALWGTEARITEMFGASAASIRAERRHFIFRYRSPRAFSRRLQELLRPDAEGLCGARRDQPARPRGRSPGADRAV